MNEDDSRWKYGMPPEGNANFAWMQHMIHHLAPHGSMALLLANGSMSSGTNNEGEIRKASSKPTWSNAWSRYPASCSPIRRFPPVSGSSREQGRPNGWRDRHGEVALHRRPQPGYMKDRVLRDFGSEDIRESPAPSTAGDGPRHSRAACPSPTGSENPGLPIKISPASANQSP